MTPSDFPPAEGNPVPSPAVTGKTPPDPAQAFDVADALVGRNLGHFRVGERLGSGAMAAVYRATDLILDRQVALKVLLPGADDVVRERFRQEARTVSVLDHPHIVRTLQVGQTDGITYIAMDLVEGTNLADLLGERGRLSITDSCRLLEPVARALSYAHRQHVVHRDVKPSNILLRRLPPDSPHGIRIAPLAEPVMPLLSDFGIALALDSPELTAAGRTVGTPTYMAPEQAADSHEIDGRADIYALGIVLYRCLVGRPPFVGSTTQILHAHVYEPLTIPEETAAELPTLVVQILQRMLAKEPDDRYWDAALLADDLALAGGILPPDSELRDQSTATMPALPSPTSSVAIERLQVLVPAPGSRTTSARRPPLAGPVPASDSPRTPAPVTSVPVGTASTTTPRLARPRRNWVGLLLGSLAALLLIVAGVALARTVLPFDQLFVQLFVPDAATPAASPATTPTLIAQTTPVAGVGTPEAPATTDAVAAGETASTPAPAETPPATPTPQPTLNIDVELFWDIAVDDYNQRAWNQTLGSLILILRSESDAFREAVAQDGQTQAQLVRTLVLDDANTPLWTRWRELFDRPQIERMFFESYVGLATAENTNGAYEAALNHLNDALAIRPTSAPLVTLRNATERMLAAGGDQTAARQALGAAHVAYADELASAEDACGAVDQLKAAATLLSQAQVETRLATVRQECDNRLAVVAGQQLRKELTGAIIYSTQEEGVYRIYRQPLAPDAMPELLVTDGRLPRLSADQRKLAFYTTRNGGQGIGGLELTADQAAAAAAFQWTTNANDGKDSPPTWSLDGGRFAFASARDGDSRVRIFLKQAVPGSAETELTPGQDPAWRPVGESWIAYSGRARDGAGPAGIWLITDNASRWQNATVNERDRRPAWSPDAQSLVFMSDGRSGNWDVYLLPLPSIDAPGPVEQLTQSPAQDGLPVFSPDGNYIAYASDEGGRWRIWVLPLEEGARPLPVVDIRGSLINWLEHSIQWVAK